MSVLTTCPQRVLCVEGRGHRPSVTVGLFTSVWFPSVGLWHKLQEGIYLPLLRLVVRKTYFKDSRVGGQVI